jgi:hypothetical protein
MMASNVVADTKVFVYTGLLLFRSIALIEIIRELKYRFDGLPIHYSVYLQSYHQGVLQRLILHQAMSSQNLSIMNLSIRNFEGINIIA